jgi:biotin synthase-related radical SAM superfamily protein
MIPELITELQSSGLRFQGQLLQRRGGAGPAEGGTFLIKGIPVSLPISSQYVSRSPYILEEEGGQYLIFKDEKAVCPVHFIERPKFYDHSTEEGIPYPKIALLHGKDCLATSVIQTCTYWHSSERCRFCGIELSHSSPCAAAIKKATGLPIHVQFCPPSNMEGLYELRDAGVDTVGIHIESFDFETLSQVAPAKAAMGFERFEKAWKMAVEIFGPNQVSSFLIAGLGEKRDSIIWGSQFLADLGVYPFVVPLRPIPGSLMENHLPPDPEEMKRIYEEVACILKRKGLSASRSLAGCVRCGACSALHTIEHLTDHLIGHPARTRLEKERAFEIRKEVFVLEQKLFSNSDIDENDTYSLHLVAEWNDQVIGTVRVFPVNNNGHWIGGRLAVRKEYSPHPSGKCFLFFTIRLESY